MQKELRLLEQELNCNGLILLKETGHKANRSMYRSLALSIYNTPL